MPKLHVANGALEGTMFHLLEKRVTVGRTEDNLIRINDSTVSKHHAVFLWDGNGYKLQDLGSTNGTRLNGESVTEANLTSGDTVAFGDVRCYAPSHCRSPADAAGQSLADLIVRIGEMIGYQSYNVKSPLNAEAAAWAQQNMASLLLEKVDLTVGLQVLALVCSSALQRAP